MNNLKNVILIFVLATIVLACAQEKKSEVAETPAVQESIPMNLAYDPSYSS